MGDGPRVSLRSGRRSDIDRLTAAVLVCMPARHSPILLLGGGEGHASFDLGDVDCGRRHPPAAAVGVRLRQTLIGALCAVLLVACGGSGGAGSPTPPAAQPPIVDRSFDFSLGNGGWLSGQADYTMDTAPADVVNDIRSLPAPFTGLGFYSAGTNRSDDLLIYVKTKISGLVAGTTYRASVTVEFLTDVSSGCVGVGGSPGDSVWIITAVSTAEPLTIFNNGNYRLNIDRGNQSVSGRDGVEDGLDTFSVTVVGPGRRTGRGLVSGRLGLWF